jgi:prepilin-type N-terminal cleavage/methylation domain-containing protein
MSESNKPFPVVNFAIPSHHEINSSLFFTGQQPRITGNQGFTIIEVLITLLVFTIAMIGITNMRALSLSGSFFNKDATTASSYAQKKMEELKSTSYGSVVSGSTQQNNMDISWTVVPNSATVTEDSLTATYNYKDVTVSVTWKQKKIELFTFISEI